MTALKKSVWLLCPALLFSFISCAPKAPSFKSLPEGPIKHHLIAAAKSASSIKARGFKGATPPKTTIYFAAGAYSQKTESNTDGSFALELPLSNASFGDFHFTFHHKEKNSIRYKLNNIDDNIRKIAKAPLGAPSEITFINIHNNNALIISSDAALLYIIPITPIFSLNNQEAKTLLLNPHQQPSLGPRTLDAVYPNAVISFFNSDQLSLLDLKSPKLLSTNAFKEAHMRSPERVLALDADHYLVSFVNYDEKTKKVSGEGVIALIKRHENALSLKVSHILPFKNPYAFVAINSHELWVLCTGTFDLSSKTLKTTNAGLIKIKMSDDKNNFTISKQLPLIDFTPAEFAHVNDTLIIPELWGPRILVLNEDACDIKESDFKNSPSPDIQFTLATHWHDDIAMLATTSSTLVAYSLSEGFFPFPFSAPIPLQQKSELAFISNQLLMRHKALEKSLEEDYAQGYSAWALSHMQNIIIPLDFLELFGP
jgi:hypothetical protein